MARPKSTELTARELAVMQVFWHEKETTADAAHQYVREQGEDIAYVTVANVVRGLVEKGCLKQTNDTRPYLYRAIRSFDQVSKRLVGDLMTRLFDGSREAMLVHLLERRKLSTEEKSYLAQVLADQEGET